MPKRKNPFGDVVPVQAKVHASFKQVATEAERQEVYDRTRTLLFKGANSPVKARSGEGNGLTSNGSSHSAAPVECSNGQQNGRHSNDGSVLVASCRCCRRKCERGVVCSHCGASTCASCSRACVKCTLTFCQFCSVLNYDEREVCCLCFDCL